MELLLPNINRTYKLLFNLNSQYRTHLVLVVENNNTFQYYTRQMFFEILFLLANQ